MDYIPKSKAYSYLKHLIGHAKRKGVQKHISMHIDTAQELVKQLDSPPKTVVTPYKINSNSVKAASLCLCIGVQELCDILNSHYEKEKK